MITRVGSPLAATMCFIMRCEGDDSTQTVPSCPAPRPRSPTLPASSFQKESVMIMGVSDACGLTTGSYAVLRCEKLVCEGEDSA